MSWPPFIEELRRRYRADEANLFLLHGGVAEGRWDIGGQAVDCLTLLVRMLVQTREVLGVFDPGVGLTFSTLEDELRFHRIVAARRTLDNQTRALDLDQLEDALVAIWTAVTTATTRQAFVILHAERLAARSRLKLPDGVPAPVDWAGHPDLRATDNALLLLADDLPAVRTGLGSGLAEVTVPADSVEVEDTESVVEE